jgi:lysophospholipid acyltransferase
MPWIGAFFLMAHLSYSQITRQLEGRTASSGSWVIDVSTPQTVLVVKLTALCWNIRDGKQKHEMLSAFQKDRAVRDLPTILDFAGYVLFFPTLLTGPGFDFAEYRRWIDMTMFSQSSTSSYHDTSRVPTIPSALLQATSKALQSTLWLLVSIKLSALTPSSTLLSASFPDHSFIYRLMHIYLFVLTTRTRCYSIWNLTEGSLIATGIGFSGIHPITNKPLWTRMCNVNPLGVETAQNVHEYIGNWNLNTGRWLKNYVYLRVVRQGEKPGVSAHLVAFVWSAVWHGFYPTYYVTFVLYSIGGVLAKEARRTLRPVFTTQSDKRLKPLYDLASWGVTHMFFSFASAPFILLSLESTLRVWSAVHYCGIWGLVALWVSCRLIRLLQTRKGAGVQGLKNWIISRGVGSMDKLRSSGSGVWRNSVSPIVVMEGSR